jgi:hypothetical protein
MAFLFYSGSADASGCGADSVHPLLGKAAVIGNFQGEGDITNGAAGLNLKARLIEVCQKRAQNPSYNNAGLQ